MIQRRTIIHLTGLGLTIIEQHRDNNEQCKDAQSNLCLGLALIGRVQTRNFSLQNLARQRTICRCELKHVTKSHWQITMAKMSELG